MSAFVTGLALSAGVAVVLKVTKTKLPAMAAVDEVSLVLPSGGPEAMPTGRVISSEWPEPGSSIANRIRGNVIDTVEAMTPSPRATAAIRTVAQNKPDAQPDLEPETVSEEDAGYAADPNVRWFNARPARPARTIWMTVTAYSPDERSCGEFADGFTATMHSVTTNAMKLVAADPTVLPYGSMVSVPGYDTEAIVPVLDCGGAIKGDKLDLLFPTHEEALQWGRQRVLVTVWEYVDGKPADNPRKLR